MAVVLTVICAFSGLLLALVHGVTKEPIEYAMLKNVKEPAVLAVINGFDNDPIKDLVKIPIGKDKKGRDAFLMVFPGKKDGKTFAMAFEAAAKGYHGDIGVMVGIDAEKNEVTGVSVVSHSETPGLGAKITEANFTDSFQGKSLEKELTKDDINALSGATLSTNGVVAAVNNARAVFDKHRDQMLQ